MSEAPETVRCDSCMVLPKRCWFNSSRVLQFPRGDIDSMGVLGISVQTLSAVSSIALTAMSTVVASVALLFSFRQNVGWKPVLLVTHSQMSGKGGEWRFKLTVQVEIWNRRKYPLVVRNVRSTVTGVELLDQHETVSAKAAHVRDNVITSRTDSIVNPSAHDRIEVEAEFEKQSLDLITPHFSIEVLVFDPHQNRELVLKTEHRFFYPEMGWTKTEQERERIRALPPPWPDPPKQREPPKTGSSFS